MNDDLQVIPLVAYDRAIASLEQIIRKLIIVIIILIAVIGAIVGYGIYYMSLYDYVDDYSVEVDSGEGNINYIGQDGDIYSGTGDSTQAQNESET